jgi:hypothetical protein
LAVSPWVGPEALLLTLLTLLPRLMVRSLPPQSLP